MSTRTSIQHTVSTNLPSTGQVGDEAFDPKTNKHYKLVAVDGVTMTWVPLYTPLNLPAKLQSDVVGAGVITVPATAADVLVTRNNLDTLTNKRLVSRVVVSSTITGTVNPTADNCDQLNIFGLTGALTIGIPAGTPVDGQKLIIRLKDNGTTRAVTWITTAGGFRPIGVTLPTATTANKTLYIGCIYNAADGYWDAIALATEA